MGEVSTIGLDIAKSVFQIHGVDNDGTVVIRKRVSRAKVLEFFAALPCCVIGIEACPSAHHWSRQLQAFGHTVKLMPPSYVKAYLKRSKNDANDAAAICEAVTRPSMRFVPTKSEQQLFDLVVTQARWLALLGDKAYQLALKANRLFNALRRIFGAPYWSMSKWAKHKVKNAVNFIGAFEKALATEAHKHKADGVICGHIHTPALHDDFGVRYVNCGDWVESCTAVAEHDDGRFEIIVWDNVRREAIHEGRELVQPERAAAA